MLLAAIPPAPTFGQVLPPPPNELKSVPFTKVLVWFQAAPGAAPVTKVDLWYTRDSAKTWQLYDGRIDPARPSPITFNAPADGLYGFFLVLHNEHGVSSPPPKAGERPQQWVFVDATAPVVQIVELRPDEHFGQNREVAIRWTVRDANLIDRPISLHYRNEQTKIFQPIADSQPAAGAFRWTVPEGIVGRITVKASATDRAGNIGKCEVETLRIDAPAIVARKPDFPALNDTTTRPIVEPKPEPEQNGLPALPEYTDRQTASASGRRPAATTTAPSAGLPAVQAAYPEPDQGLPNHADPAAEEVQKRYDRAGWHRKRGENAQAIATYREVLRLKPDFAEARIDLAEVLFACAEYVAAETELKEVLAADARQYRALKTLALVEAARRNYRSASDTLHRLLQLNENDPDAWLYLGDVTMFLGDRVAARGYWTKAASFETASQEVKDRSAKRLTIYRNQASSAPESD